MLMYFIALTASVHSFLLLAMIILFFILNGCLSQDFIWPFSLVFLEISMKSPSVVISLAIWFCLSALCKTGHFQQNLMHFSSTPGCAVGGRSTSDTFTGVSLWSWLVLHKVPVCLQYSWKSWLLYSFMFGFFFFKRSILNMQQYINGMYVPNFLF